MARVRYIAVCIGLEKKREQQKRKQGFREEITKNKEGKGKEKKATY